MEVLRKVCSLLRKRHKKEMTPLLSWPIAMGNSLAVLASCLRVKPAWGGGSLGRPSGSWDTWLEPYPSSALPTPGGD